MPIAAHIVSALDRLDNLSPSNIGRLREIWNAFFVGSNADYLIKDPLPDAVPSGKEALDKEIFLLIYTHTDADYSYIFKSLSSALDAWKAVLRTFVASDFKNQVQVFQYFINYQHDHGLPMPNFIGAIESYVKRLEGLGDRPHDSQIIAVLISNLHSSYSQLQRDLLKKVPAPTLAETKAALLSGDTSAADSDDGVIKKEEEHANVARSPAPRFTGTRPAAGVSARGGSAGLRAATPSPSPSSRLSPHPPSQVDVPPSQQTQGGSLASGNEPFRWCRPIHPDQCHRCGRSGHIAAHCVADMPQHVKDWVIGGAPRSAILSANAAAQEDDADGYPFGDPRDFPYNILSSSQKQVILDAGYWLPADYITP